MKGGNKFPVPVLGAVQPEYRVSSTDYSSTFIPFIGQVIGEQIGWLSLGIYHRPTGRMRVEFIRYPEDVGHAERIIQRIASTHDLYYCPHLFGEPTRREKANVLDTVGGAWADLDTCHPDRLIIPPSVVTETSTGRYQALWLFTYPQAKEVAENISYRIARAYGDDGCDRSGWDLTQLMRIPDTPNHKYPGKPVVRVLSRDSSGKWGER